MKYYYKELEITSKAEWKKAFCEEYNSNGEDKHWKDGRSGECLAEDFIGENPNGEMSMKEMIHRFLGSKSISQQRKYVNGLTNTEADKRLDELVKDYLSGNENDHGKLRYQLLYYLAGSFCEMTADIIFMPVIVYETRGKSFNEYSDSKGKTNKSAYELFMTKLGFEPMEQVVGGDIKLAYHKRVSAHGMEKDVYSCYIVK